MLSSLGKLLAGILCLILLGCVDTATKHEALGDRAYVERRYGDALAEYRVALVQRTDDREIRGKAAAAALHAGDLVAAAEEYIAVGTAGSDRLVSEAADGLARVAQAAADADDQIALATAVDGLGRIAPGRALGHFAGQLAIQVGEGPASDEMLSVLFYAAAAAPDARLQDSLMYAYAATLRRLGQCEDAIPVFESLMRRQLEPVVMERARDALGYCALLLGQRAVDAGLPLTAEEWFLRAIQRAGSTVHGRRAYLGLGDVLFARADYVGAAVAYESALLGGAPGGPIYEQALAKLSMVERAGTGIP
jgi:tetratricopeptide (TPR) repeat protein